VATHIHGKRTDPCRLIPVLRLLARAMCSWSLWLLLLLLLFASLSYVMPSAVLVFRLELSFFSYEGAYENFGRTEFWYISLIGRLALFHPLFLD
jgi:hypothetical protein